MSKIIKVELGIKVGERDVYSNMNLTETAILSYLSKQSYKRKILDKNIVVNFYENGESKIIGYITDLSLSHGWLMASIFIFPEHEEIGRKLKTNDLYSYIKMEYVNKLFVTNTCYDSYKEVSDIINIDVITIQMKKEMVLEKLTYTVGEIKKTSSYNVDNLHLLKTMEEAYRNIAKLLI